MCVGCGGGGGSRDEDNTCQISRLGRHFMCRMRARVLLNSSSVPRTVNSKVIIVTNFVKQREWHVGRGGEGCLFQAANLAAWNFQIFQAAVPSSQLGCLEFPAFSKQPSSLLGISRNFQAAKLAAWNFQIFPSSQVHCLEHAV